MFSDLIMREFLNNFLELVAVLVPFSIIVLKYRKEQKLELSILLVFFLISAILNSIITILAFKDLHNNFFYNLRCTLLSFVLSLYFYLIFISKNNRNLSIIVGSIFLSGILINLIFFDEKIYFSSLSNSLLNIQIIIFCILYFIEKIQFAESDKIYSSYAFWIVSSLFLYYSSSFFILITFKVVTNGDIEKMTMHDRRMFSLLWATHNLFYLASNVIASVGLIWKDYPKKYM